MLAYSCFRYETCSELSQRPQKFRLKDISDSLTSVPGDPCEDRLIESTPLPPMWILTCKMRDEFVSTHALSLADSVSGKREAYSSAATTIEEADVLGIEFTA